MKALHRVVQTQEMNVTDSDAQSGCLPILVGTVTMIIRRILTSRVSQPILGKVI